MILVYWKLMIKGQFWPVDVFCYFKLLFKIENIYIKLEVLLYYEKNY